MASGVKGPLECVVLNACSTEKMGLLLRTHNVPYVLCWRTPVQDEIAQVMCQLFYRALVQDDAGERDYRRAFLAATDMLRSSRHTGGAAQRPHGALDMHDSHGTSLKGGNIHSNTQSLIDDEGGSSRSRPVCSQEDVILFLGKDGDIEPIYLWRQRLAPLLPSAVSHDLESGGAEEAGDAALKAIFAQRNLGAMCVDVCRELGVDSVDDLSYVTLEQFDELPNYLKDQLKGARRNKLLALLGLKPRVGGQHKEAAHAVT